MAKLLKISAVYYSDLRIRCDGSRCPTPNKKQPHNHRRRLALSSDKEIAEEKLDALKKEQRARRRGEVVTDTSWGAFKKKYLQFSQTKKDPVTHGHNLRAFANLEAAFPIAEISQVTPELLDDLNVQWTAAGRGLYVRNREIRALKTAMRKAEAWKFAVPADWRSVKEDREPKGRLHFHTPDQLRALIQFCRSRPVSPLWLTVCLLGARAGLRREEMQYLEWSDIDFKNNRIHIAPKAGWNPKDYERRWIPIFSDLRQHLAQIKGRAKEGWILAQEGDRPTVGSMTEYFGRLTHKAGLKGSIHTLRHTFGAHLAQAGVSLRKIQAWMGHASIETTEIYAHLMPVDAGEKDIEKLPA